MSAPTSKDTAPAPQRLINFYQSFYKRSPEALETALPSGIDDSHRRALSETAFNTIKEYQEGSIDDQRDLLAKKAKDICFAFVEALTVLEGDKSILYFILLNIDAILFDVPDSVKYLIEAGKDKPTRDIIKFLQRLLPQKDNVYSSGVYDSAARILSAILSDFDQSDKFVLDCKTMISYLITSANKPKKTISDYMTVVCFSNLLIVPSMPSYFLSLNGFDVLSDILERNSKDLQIAYYTFLNYWILSYEEAFKPIATDPKKLLIANILSCLKKVAREKLTRVALKIFRNLCKWDECIVLLIDNNLSDFLRIEMKKEIKNEKTKENISFLTDILDKNYKTVSSFEKFVKEIRTEKLNFNFCHTEKFWKENIKRAEDDDFWVIKKLIELLDSKDYVTQAVACFDLGEFSRLHPFAKNILEKEGGKDKLMAKINSENSAVREQALGAVQKLIITKLHPY